MVMCAGASASGAPVITGVDGVVTSGKTVTISGTGFGAHSGLSSIEWTGANIEAGKPGDAYAKAGWRVQADRGQFTTARYSKARAHSGSQSILCRMKDGDDGTGDGATNEYGAGLGYDPGAPFTSAYATWWVYFDDKTANKGQWKIWRVMQGNSLNSGTHAMSSEWFKKDGGASQGYWLSANPPDSRHRKSHWLRQFAYKGEWMRFEIYIQAGAKGRLMYNVYTSAHGVKLMGEGADFADSFRYLMWQNYYGNHGRRGDPGLLPTDVEIYIIF